MKTIGPLLLSLAFGAAFTACDSSSTSSTQATIEMSTPAGWRRASDTVVDDRTAKIGLIAPLDVAGVYAYQTKAAGLTPSQIATAFAEAYQSGAVSGAHVDSNSTFAVGGQTGARLQLSYSLSSGGSSVSIIHRALFASFAGNDFQIEFVRQASDTASARGFQEIESSISIH